MTKNTLAAALMAACVAILVLLVWLVVYRPMIAVALLLSALFFVLWGLFQNVAQDIIEARRKRGEGTK